REFGSGQSSRDLGKNKLRNTFKCAVYFKEFGSRSALVGHIRALYRKCLVCSKVFETGEDLEDYKRANSCVKKDQKHIAAAHYADRFVQICTQEVATSSTSVHRNVREVAGHDNVTILELKVNVARCAFCDNDTYSNKAFEAVEFLDITFVIAANMLDPISKTIKLEPENERTNVAELDFEIFK
ncbi:hypothetical protein Tco_1443455, partial [Tanacetum coccineum]